MTSADRYAHEDHENPRGARYRIRQVTPAELEAVREQMPFLSYRPGAFWLIESWSKHRGWGAYSNYLTWEECKDRLIYLEWSKARIRKPKKEEE